MYREAFLSLQKAICLLYYKRIVPPRSLRDHPSRGELSITNIHMLLSIFLLLIGFVLLIKGADWMVDGSSSVARRLHVSDLVIGLTIVAFGTSAPELVVGLASAFSGNTDIAIGNVLGSTIANTLLILGVSAIITPLKVNRNTVWKEIPLAFLAVLMLGILANDTILDDKLINDLSRGDGLVFLGFFIVFLYYTFGVASKTPEEIAEDSLSTNDEPLLTWKMSITLILAGLMGLVAGGQLVVSQAVSLALSWGVSETLVGFTIVAVGTSLPELVTSAIAARKGKTDIAIGNVIGSNIFNIFWILGITSLIAPIPFAETLNIDLGVGVLAMGSVFVALFIGKRHQIERWQGGLGIIAYAVYLGYLIWRG